MRATARPAAFDASTQYHRALLAKVHVAKKVLGLDDDTYRAVLLRVAGETSAANCSDAQLVALVKEFEAKGFTAKAKKPSPRPADHPLALKARAMWISLYQLGVVENPSEQALEAFACRQLGVAKLQWANQREGNKLIEALKAMAERAGWSQDLSGVAPAMRVLVLRRRLVVALLDHLREACLIPNNWDLRRAAWELGGVEIRNVSLLEHGEIDVLAKTFGKKLRGAIR
jgi:phage gp16-like protein